MSMIAANALNLEPHPACLILPDMDANDFQKLKEDVSGFGLLHPIVLYQGKILDGRHRYRACLELGIEPVFEDWQGGSAVIEYVLSENLLRRHLSASQKAMVATRAMEYHKAEAKKRQSAASNAPLIASGKNNTVSAPGALTTETNVVDFPSDNGKAAASAAKTVGVSPRTVEQIVYVRQPRAAPLDDAQPL